MYNHVMPEHPFPHAAIVQANYAQFSAGEHRQFKCVQSRMLLWCKAGNGTVVVNDRAKAIDPGRYLFLPWKHSITYRASREDPFFLAGIHLIPNHAPDDDLVYEVAHDASSPLADAPGRRDLPLRALTGVQQGRFTPGEPLAQLAEYIVQNFVRSDPPQWQARQLAQQLLYELILAKQKRQVHEHDVPPELERIKQYVQFNIRRPMSLSDLAEFADLSPSTIGRMFRHHLHTTPVTWILAVKMEQAAKLLRTRRLPVAQVANAIGFDDPRYFSKCFSKTMGQSPLAYRQQSRSI